MLNQAAKTFGFASSVRPAFVFRHLSAAHCQRPSKNSPQSPAGTPLISATNATNHSSLHRPVAAASPVFGIARCPHRLTARGGRGGAPAGRKGPICSHSLKNAGPLIRGPSFPEHSPLRRYYRSYTNPNPSLAVAVDEDAATSLSLAIHQRKERHFAYRPVGWRQSLNDGEAHPTAWAQEVEERVRAMQSPPCQGTMNCDAAGRCTSSKKRLAWNMRERDGFLTRVLFFSSAMRTGHVTAASHTARIAAFWTLTRP